MSREIKFRAWDEEELEFYKYDLTWHIVNDERFSRNMYGLILEQFSGLHDKNGVEIYEGDIITDDPDKCILYSIEFIKGCFVAVSKDREEIFTFEHRDDFLKIGTKLENPELLEQ